MTRSEPLRVVDLFAGMRGWSAAFAARGHETFTVEWDYFFRPIDLHKNILKVTRDDFPWMPDIVLASPPCTAFTTMTMGRNWTYDGEPRTPVAEMGRALVLQTRALIEALAPAYFVIENPRARLRTLPYLADLERRTVWYCRLGEDGVKRTAKPTDLWGAFPPSLVLPPGCHNGNPDHISAPRGSRTGTQGGEPGHVAAIIPYRLSELVCMAAERDLGYAS